MRFIIPLLAVLLMGAGDTGEHSWDATRVLILGDSLVGDGSGLEMELRKRLKESGAGVETMWEMGARVSTCDHNEDMHRKVKVWRPDVIIISLGMNSSRTPVKTYAKDVKDFLLLRYRPHQCFWIGPPILVEGTGYAVAKMKDTVERHTNCKYFDTAGEVTFPPKSVSGFHVKRWKGKKWAVKVWDWIQDEGGPYGRPCTE